MGQSEIPEKWRAQALSEVRVSEAGVSMMIWFDSWLEAKRPGQSANRQADPISSCYYREQDFCYIEDDATPGGFERPSSQGEYVGD